MARQKYEVKLSDKDVQTIKEALNKSAKCEKSGEIRRISPENCKYRPKLSNL